MRNKIEKLLNSNLSTYAISKATGITSSSLSNLRNEKRKLDNLSLFNAERLYNYYKEMEIMLEITSWLKEFGTVEKYSSTKKERELIENAQPLDFVSFYYSKLEKEKEEMDFEGTYEELAEMLNLAEVKPEETFIQLNVIDWGDTTNATAFYLSEIDNKEQLINYVNEALDIDQVTHSSGLKSRYQFI
jgi:transcriptional regulator with XRE-family HTH domain